LNLYRKATGVIGWKSLFIRITDNDATNTNTADYNVGTSMIYEACTAASNIYTCTACFSARPNNIFSVTLSATEASYFGSAITYCHDNTNSVFSSNQNEISVLINDGKNGQTRDVDALQLDRVLGCTSYTSLVLGTCTTCGTGLKKSTDSTKCLQANGNVVDGTNPNKCATFDETTLDGKCATCPDT
jgi:hypothetical protein